MTAVKEKQELVVTEADLNMKVAEMLQLMHAETTEADALRRRMYAYLSETTEQLKHSQLELRELQLKHTIGVTLSSLVGSGVAVVAGALAVVGFSNDGVARSWSSIAAIFANLNWQEVGTSLSAVAAGLAAAIAATSVLGRRRNR